MGEESKCSKCGGWAVRDCRCANCNQWMDTPIDPLPEDRRQQELIGGLLEIATQHIDAGAYDEAKLTIKHAMEKNWER